MTTKSKKSTTEKTPLHVEGACVFTLPIDHLGWAPDSERVASYAVAMAALVPRFPSLTFTVSGDKIEASIDACALVNDISLEGLIRGVLEAGEEQYKEYTAWKERQAKLPTVSEKAKAKKAA